MGEIAELLEWEEGIEELKADIVSKLRQSPAHSGYGLREREGDQPLPLTHAINEDVCVQDEVVKDIAARKQVGVQRYGSVLRPFNGRSALVDAYQEAMDLAMYLKQELLERAGIEDQVTVSGWSIGTFGRPEAYRAARRAWEEMKEFDEAIPADGKLSLRDVQELAGEAADVVITLFTFAQVAGLDLMGEVNKKMAINRGRTWVADGTGCGYHKHVEP